MSRLRLARKNPSKLYRAPGPYRTTSTDCEHVPAAAGSKEPIEALSCTRIQQATQNGRDLKQATAVDGR
ncbi:unnamed protein product [Penicillium nalgiovense]|nr:unnamed protein product [Penicillium nalgiovense]